MGPKRSFLLGYLTCLITGMIFSAMEAWLPNFAGPLKVFVPVDESGVALDQWWAQQEYYLVSYALMLAMLCAAMAVLFRTKQES